MTTAEEPGAGPGPPDGPGHDEAQQQEGLVIRDKRRARGGKGGKHAAEPADEPAAGGPADSEATPGGKHAAEPTGPAEPPAGGLGAELATLRKQLDERTTDLQRVSAEFANYRRRVERDKAAAADEATAAVFRALLPVFDDLDRAREHGELAEGVAAVVDQLVTTAGKFGLTPVGEQGDPFDPNRHEAVAHRTSPEVTEPTCVDVLRRGYLLGDRLLRPAMVAVAEPGDDPEPAAAPQPAEARPAEAQSSGAEPGSGEAGSGESD